MKMTIKGIEINPGLLNACISRMEAAPFKANDIEGVARKHSSQRLSVEVEIRVADRLIQHFRKQGKIEYSNRYWTWTTIQQAQGVTG